MLSNTCFSFKKIPKKNQVKQKHLKLNNFTNVHYLKENLMYNKSYQICFAWKLFVLEFYSTLFVSRRCCLRQLKNDYTSLVYV